MRKENKMISRKIFVVFFGFFAIIIAFLFLRYIVLAMRHGGAITISFNAHNEMYVEFFIITIIFIFLITGSVYLFRNF